MLAFISRLVSTTRFLSLPKGNDLITSSNNSSVQVDTELRRSAATENYDILSDSDKKAIASHLPSSMLQSTEVEWSDIDSAATMFGGNAALVSLHSGRRIHVTARSFWANSEQVRAVGAIALVVKEANAKEAARLAVRQLETERALRLAIQERRQRQMVAA